MTLRWKDWRIAAGLLFLSLVPVAAGTHRVLQIMTGAVVTPENARFMEAPAPVVLHILSVTVYCVLGAFQFVSVVRTRYQRWHRTAGRILVPAGLAASLSGLWMTFFYAWPQYDGYGLFIVRIIVGSVMTACLLFGYVAIRRGEITRHRAWMMRAYALGIGAGSQVFTHIPWALLPEYHNELFRTVSMTAGWVINAAIVEWRLASRKQ